MLDNINNDIHNITFNIDHKADNRNKKVKINVCIDIKSVKNRLNSNKEKIWTIPYVTRKNEMSFVWFIKRKNTLKNDRYEKRENFAILIPNFLCRTADFHPKPLKELRICKRPYTHL